MTTKADTAWDELFLLLHQHGQTLSVWAPAEVDRNPAAQLQEVALADAVLLQDVHASWPGHVVATGQFEAGQALPVWTPRRP